MVQQGRIRRAMMTAAVLLGVSLVGCGGGGGGGGGDAEPAVATYPANGEVAAVLSLDNNFVPQELTVVAGTEVRWDNNGRNDHNVLPEGDPEATTWGAPVDVFHPGDSYSHVFATPGTYVYYCSIHGTAQAGMFGTITVTAP